MMTFIGDIESLLPASTTSESCQQKSNSGADLATTLLLESVFGTDTLPPKPAQHHEAQDTVACLNSNGEYKKCGKADHADNKSNLISIHYSEKEKRERKYECQHCKKRFTRPSSLTSHVYTHTGERPFACEFLGCTKRFSVLSNLRRHYKVHASRRSYGGGGDRGGGSRLPSTSLYSGTLFGSALADRAGFAFGAELNGTMSSASSRNPFATPLAHSATRSLYNSGQVLPDRQAYIPSTGSQLGLGSAVMPADFSSYGASGYAPSFRTTAPTLSAPLTHPCTNQSLSGTAGCYSSNPFDVPLLAAASYSSNQAAATPECQASRSQNSSLCSSDSSNTSSPTSKRPLCLEGLGSSHGSIVGNLAPAGNTTTVGRHPESSLMGWEFDSIFGRVPTAGQHRPLGGNSGGSSSDSGDSSSDHAFAAAVSLSPIGGQEYAATGPFDALDMLVKADSLPTATRNNDGGGMHTGLSGFLPRSPLIATPSILTNSSVTTKAMHGGIVPARISGGEDLTLLLSNIGKHQQQQPPQLLDQAGMASGVNNFLGSNNGDMATSSLLGSLAEFKGGDGRSNDKDPVWRLLQAGYNMQ